MVWRASDCHIDTLAGRGDKQDGFFSPFTPSPHTAAAPSYRMVSQTLTAQTDNKTASLPSFLQRKIHFKDASADDRPALITYSSNIKKKQPTQMQTENNSESVQNGPKIRLFDPSSLRMEWERVVRPACGLRNVGNTCFLNSVLQCLNVTVPLNSLLMSGEHRRRCLGQARGEHCMLCELGGLFRQQHGGNSNAVVPGSIISRIKSIAKHLRVGRQEDAHEFLRYFVDSLQRAALLGAPSDLDAASKETTSVQSIFGGNLQSCITCQSCKQHSLCHDPFLDLSLEVRPGDNFSLEDALAHFVRRESLTRGNKYRCSACGQLTEATKQLKLHRTPPILTVHLKRFGTGLGHGMMFGGGTAKISKHIPFPVELDLTAYMSEESKDSEPRYSLYAVLVHDGHSTNSGHYYSFVKASNGLWYCMNDESVTQASLNTVLRQRAYLLFYQRITTVKHQEPEQVFTASHAAAIKDDAIINVEDSSSDCTDLPRSSSMWHTSPSPILSGTGSVRNGGPCRPMSMESRVHKAHVRKHRNEKRAMVPGWHVSPLK